MTHAQGLVMPLLGYAAMVMCLSMREGAIW